MSVASTKFARAAFALVEVLIVVAAIALHLAIIYIVLALPIGRIKKHFGFTRIVDIARTRFRQPVTELLLVRPHRAESALAGE
jgi:hypothetical protein